MINVYFHANINTSVTRFKTLGFFSILFPCLPDLTISTIKKSFENLQRSSQLKTERRCHEKNFYKLNSFLFCLHPIGEKFTQIAWFLLQVLLRHWEPDIVDIVYTSIADTAEQLTAIIIDFGRLF